MIVSNDGIRRRARLFAFSLAASLFCGMGCASVESDGESVGAVTSALGSPYSQVTSIGNWTQLTQMVSNGNYKLTTNLNASGKSWTPKDFTGTFDGGGFTISNLTVNVSNSTGAGFFSNLTSAIVRNVKFTNVNITGNYMAGGLAGSAEDSLIESVSVEGTVSAPGGLAAGGLVGLGGGSTFTLCSMKGTVSGALRYAGGITGYLNAGSFRGFVTQSYSWATISPDTSDVNREVWAGGLVGWSFGATIQDAYAVGNVTGRGHAGGLVGALDCDESHQLVLNHGVYRGDVVDKNRTATGGWSGTFGTYQECVARFDQNLWDRTLDQSSSTGTRPNAQASASTAALMSPTTVSSGVFNFQDNKFDASIWEPGNGSQHHALKGMPGGLTTQPRCTSNTGVPTAC